MRKDGSNTFAISNESGDIEVSTSGSTSYDVVLSSSGDVRLTAEVDVEVRGGLALYYDATIHTFLPQPMV